MWQLFQFPLCPFSRKVRLVMGEKGMGYELWRENPWEARDEFRAMNPAGTTPVLHDPEKGITLADSRAICEYLEETVERNPLIIGTATARAEIRRLVALFDEVFYADVTAPLLSERMKKRLILRQSPDSRMLREAMRLAHEHLYYIDYLGGLDWTGHEQARAWYSVFKSRPSFRPLLTERMEVIQPPAHYADVNA